MNNLKELCELYFNLFSNKNVDELFKLFSENIELTDWNVNVTGNLAVRQEYKNIFNDVNTIEVQTIKYYEEDNTVCCEILIIINNIQTIEVIDVITFDESNKIKKIKAYKI